MPRPEKYVRLPRREERKKKAPAHGHNYAENDPQWGEKQDLAPCDWCFGRRKGRKKKEKKEAYDQVLFQFSLSGKSPRASRIERGGKGKRRKGGKEVFQP